MPSGIRGVDQVNSINCTSVDKFCSATIVSELPTRRQIIKTRYIMEACLSKPTMQMLNAEQTTAPSAQPHSLPVAKAGLFVRLL